jgi:hypothetical protein
VEAFLPEVKASQEKTKIAILSIRSELERTIKHQVEDGLA